MDFQRASSESFVMEASLTLTACKRNLYFFSTSSAYLGSSIRREATIFLSSLNSMLQFSPGLMEALEGLTSNILSVELNLI